MTEQELENCRGHKVRLTDKNGNVYEALAKFFESSYDNEPNEACITLELQYGLVEFNISEIQDVERISK